MSANFMVCRVATAAVPDFFYAGVLEVSYTEIRLKLIARPSSFRATAKKLLQAASK